METTKNDKTYTATEVFDWLAEQRNLAMKADDNARADVIWSVLMAWTDKNK